MTKVFMVDLYEVEPSGNERWVQTCELEDCFDITESEDEASSYFDTMRQLSGGVESVDIGGGASTHYRIKRSTKYND